MLGEEERQGARKWPAKDHGKVASLANLRLKFDDQLEDGTGYRPLRPIPLWGPIQVTPMPSGVRVSVLPALHAVAGLAVFRHAVARSCPIPGAMSAGVPSVPGVVRGGGR